VEFKNYATLPSDSRVIEFHLIADGRGYIRVGGESTPLAAGDIVMLPHGDPHVMGNGLATAAIDGSAGLPTLVGGQLDFSHLGGGGEETRLICGYLVCDERLVAPVLNGLPRVVRVNSRADSAGVLLERMILHAVAQLAAAAPGSKAIVARLAEVLFAEALRLYVLQLPPGRAGWLAGAADPAIGRALAALHLRPAHPWTVNELAEEAGLSRSTLTERFARYLDQGPMAYLADWRLELAAEALRTSDRSVLQVATDVGYDSEAAFNRAFKRRFDTPPARYRRLWRESARQGVAKAESGGLHDVAKHSRNAGAT
jgi:AraC-like DNA-binding protein